MIMHTPYKLYNNHHKMIMCCVQMRKNPLLNMICRKWNTVKRTNHRKSHLVEPTIASLIWFVISWNKADILHLLAVVMGKLVTNLAWTPSVVLPWAARLYFRSQDCHSILSIWEIFGSIQCYQAKTVVNDNCSRLTAKMHAEKLSIYYSVQVVTTYTALFHRWHVMM
jgi:hypothetical protein